MKLVLRDELAHLWRDRDAFSEVRSLSGDVIRDREGRQTLRFQLGGKTYYRKLHIGIGWREILKNFLQLKRPVVGASNEWRAINRLAQLGVDTLTAVAYGKRGCNPARQLSFLVTEELIDTLSLARYTETWPLNPPPPDARRALVAKVADIARTLHQHGINHRDLYLCHFLLDVGGGEAWLAHRRPRLFLVDLHRAQIRRRVPLRWQVKDLASLYFSALDVGLTRSDVYRFLRIYFNQPLRQILRDRKRLLTRVTRRASKLYRRDFKRLPRLPV